MSYMTSLLSGFISPAPTENIPNLEMPLLNEPMGNSPSHASNPHHALTNSCKIRIVMPVPMPKAFKLPRPTLQANATVTKCTETLCVVEYAEKVQLIQNSVDGMIRDPHHINVLVYRLVCHIVDLSCFLTTNANFPAIEKDNILHMASEFQQRHVMMNVKPDMERLNILCAMFKDTFQYPLRQLLGRTVYAKTLFALCSFFIFARDVVEAVTNNKDDPLAKTLNCVCARREWTYTSSPSMTFQPIMIDYHHKSRRHLLPPPSPLDHPPPLEI
jgi:hypothetical protein